MCGIYAILESSDIIHKLINGLFHLQHRGQESSGICVLNNKNDFIERKSFGLLKKLISDDIYKAVKYTPEVYEAIREEALKRGSKKDGKLCSFLS